MSGVTFSIETRLSPEDVPALEAILRESDPFVAHSIVTDDPYALGAFLLNSVRGGLKVAAILDRNLVTRVLNLAKGQEIDHSLRGAREYRVAAACMAFLIEAEIQLEPNISLYEAAQSAAESGDGHAELGLFRIADHIHPQAYLEIALGRASGFHPEVINQAGIFSRHHAERHSSIDFEKPLRRWRWHRCALTQIALLDRKKISGYEKLCGFLEWCIAPGFFDGISLGYAIKHFGRCRPSGALIGGVQSSSRERFFDGVRNAAWDLAYISQWTKQIKMDGVRRAWILCTQDKTLKSVARFVVGEWGFHQMLHENWNRREAEGLMKIYDNAKSLLQSSERLEKLGTLSPTRIDELRASIEAEIWQCASK